MIIKIGSKTKTKTKTESESESESESKNSTDDKTDTHKHTNDKITLEKQFEMEAYKYAIDKIAEANRFKMICLVIIVLGLMYFASKTQTHT